MAHISIVQRLNSKEDLLYKRYIYLSFGFVKASKIKWLHTEKQLKLFGRSALGKTKKKVIRLTISEEATPGQIIWTEQQPFIAKQAKDLARSFRHVVDEEDLLQEAWVFCWQREADFLARNCRGVYIRTCLKNVMMNHALKMRDQVLRDTDDFYYGANEVRELLPTFLSSYEAWTSSPVPPGAETMTKNDNVEIFIDFSRAWDRLTEKQQNILIDRYGGLPDENEEAKAAMSDTERRALLRAMNRFLDLLHQNQTTQNRSYEGPGGYLTNPETPRRISSSAAGIAAVQDR